MQQIKLVLTNLYQQHKKCIYYTSVTTVRRWL